MLALRKIGIDEHTSPQKLYHPPSSPNRRPPYTRWALGARRPQAPAIHLRWPARNRSRPPSTLKQKMPPRRQEPPPPLPKPLLLADPGASSCHCKHRNRRSVASTYPYTFQPTAHAWQSRPLNQRNRTAVAMLLRRKNQIPLFKSFAEGRK